MNEIQDQHIDLNDRFDVFTYERYYADGACVIRDGDRIISMGETDKAYFKQVIPPDPETVATQISYFPDTLTVSGYGHFIKDWNIEIGVWKTFDRYGEVVKEINKDEHYPVSWEKMRARFLDNGIQISDIRTLRRTLDIKSGRYLWILTLKSPHGVLDMAYFDAETGDMIDRKQIQIQVS